MARRRLRTGDPALVVDGAEAGASGRAQFLRAAGPSLLALTAALILAAPAQAATSHTAYVTDFSGGTVTPIDTATDTAGTPIAAGADPVAVAFTPDGKTAYVTNYDDSTVTPIDTATETAGTPIGVGTNPVSIAITPDGTTAYVANGGDDTVTPIATATNIAGTPIGVGSDPEAVAITPDGKTAYVANALGDTVTPIATATNIAGTAITVGTNPLAIAITPDGKTAYVDNIGSDNVTPIDVATNASGPAITVGSNPDAIAITPDGQTAYVGNFSGGSVTPIDIASDTAGAAIGAGLNPESIAITPDGTTAYVANGGDDTVTPIDTATNTTRSAIAAGSFPAGVAIIPDQPPTAAFTATAATVGEATSFDASASTDADGTIASYSWDFGDGAMETTSSPTTTHPYGAAGSYTAAVTETDEIGCSTAQVFTGQTMSCNGSLVAQISHPVTVAPAKPTIDSYPRRFTDDPNASFAFHSDDPNASLRCRLVGREARFGPCSSPKDYAGLAEGDYRFRIVALDNGIRSPTAVRNLTVDLTPPIAEIDGGPSGTSGPTVDFTFSGTDPGTDSSGILRFRCRLDDNPAETCTSPRHYSSLAAGPHRFVVRAVDRARNRSAPAVRRWTVVP